jgi:hypothetical protein
MRQGDKENRDMIPQSPRLLAYMSFLASGSAAAAGIGLLAATISLTGWAPVGIFSLGVGVAVGVTAMVLASWFKVSCPQRLATATLGMALVAVVAQHAWLYRDYRQQWHAVREREPMLALFRTESAPMSFGEYLAVEASPGRIAFWFVDLVLVASAATGILLLGRRLPEKIGVAADAKPSSPPIPDP